MNLFTSFISLFKSPIVHQNDLKPRKPLKVEQRPEFDVLILPKDLPDFMRQCKQFRGVYVGRCIGSAQEWDDRKYGAAHCHNDKRDPWYGFICAKNHNKVLMRTTMAHEISHLISASGHNLKWAKVYTSIEGMPKFLTVQWLACKYGFKLPKGKKSQ